MIDHLVYATRDLEETVAVLAAKLGVEPTPGGPHPGIGTRNYVVSLGNRSYLEIIGPDREQPTPTRPRPFGIDELRGAHLVTWATAVHDLDLAMARSSRAGWDAGDVIPLSRRLPDGTELSWRVAMRPAIADHAVVPFLIDWGNQPADIHPSVTAVGGVTLVSLEATDPEPDVVATRLEALGVHLPCERDAASQLAATLAGLNGRVFLS